jgi:uncharacterized membrane protein
MAMEQKVIGIFITILLTAILIPVAFSQIFNANTTGWDTNTVTIFGLIPIIGVVAIILILVFAYYSRRE